MSWRCSRDLTSNELIYEICLTGVTGRKSHETIGWGVSNGSSTAMRKMTNSQDLAESSREFARGRGL